MRHVSVLLVPSLVLGLAACSIVGGGKLGPGGGGGGGQTMPAQPEGGGGPSAGDAYQKTEALPRNLISPSERYDKIIDYLEKMEKQLEAGTLNRASDIHSVRILWLGYFGSMVRGGEPPCPACKNHARFKEMTRGTADINARFAKLEKAVANCTYGYRMSNGDLLPMTLDWSEADWNDISEKAMPAGYRQRERCWLDTKEGKAGKAQAWAY